MQATFQIDMIVKYQPEGVVIIRKSTQKIDHYQLGKSMTYPASSGKELKCYLGLCSHPMAGAYPILNIIQYYPILIELS
jgi:hypothetical protein